MTDSIPVGENGKTRRVLIICNTVANVGMAYASVLAWYLHAHDIALMLVGATGLLNLHGLRRPA